MSFSFAFEQAFSSVLCILFFSAHVPCAQRASMVQNWKAELVDDPSLPAGKYKVEFTWEHLHDSTVVVDYQGGLGKVKKPTDDPRCDGSSEAVASDGQPFWMPRFNPREVPADVTSATGIQFASIDWQPCGHKDITICHAESHYDIHFYYVPEEYLESMPMCQIGSDSNSDLPICQDLPIKANHDYFKLIRDNLPTSYKKSSNNVGGLAEHVVDFCVDPTSAILRSGVHYGDKADTVSEWKSPVTIVGSHDCKLLFFEPMISWRWISDSIWRSVWPNFTVKDIEYNNKTFKPLPDGWSIEVSQGCKTDSTFSTTTQGTCTIKLTLIGDSCATTPDAAECKLTRQCDNFETLKDCVSNRLYEAPFDLSLYPELAMERDPTPEPPRTELTPAPQPEVTSLPTEPPTEPATPSPKAPENKSNGKKRKKRTTKKKRKTKADKRKSSSKKSGTKNANRKRKSKE